MTFQKFFIGVEEKKVCYFLYLSVPNVSLLTFRFVTSQKDKDSETQITMR